MNHGLENRSTAGDDIALSVKSLTHRYKEYIALDDFSIDARKGEFLTILGPSGSGKTTLLKILAGLEKPTEVRELSIGGKSVIDVPSNLRDVVTVFQHYALFPHMSVFENIEYGLRLRKVPLSKRKSMVNDILELVRLPDKVGRNIHQLSGGEKQRVALARALVVRPAILLLDEPIGALDEKLRVEMQVELSEIQRSLSITFLYVTHSKEEALTMSDRIILMREGKIEQQGTSDSLYERPESKFVAEFMGIDNIIVGSLIGSSHGHATIEKNGVELTGTWVGEEPPAMGAEAFMAIRGEMIRQEGVVTSAEKQENTLEYQKKRVLYKGRYHDTTIDTKIGELVTRDWQESISNTSQVSWRISDCTMGPMN